MTATSFNVAFLRTYRAVLLFFFFSCGDNTHKRLVVSFFRNSKNLFSPRYLTIDATYYYRVFSVVDKYACSSLNVIFFLVFTFFVYFHKFIGAGNDEAVNYAYNAISPLVPLSHTHTDGNTHNGSVTIWPQQLFVGLGRYHLCCVINSRVRTPVGIIICRVEN